MVRCRFARLAASVNLRTPGDISPTRTGTSARRPWTEPASAGDVDLPVVAAEGTAGVLEVALFHELEAELAADPVRRSVRDAGIGVDHAPSPLGTGAVEERAHRRGGEPATLEGRKHHPADLVDRSPVLVVVPDANRPGLGPTLVGNDHAVPDPASLDVIHDAPQLRVEALARERPPELGH